MKNDKDSKLAKFLAWAAFIGGIIVFITENWDRIPKPPIDGFGFGEEIRESRSNDGTVSDYNGASLPRDGEFHVEDIQGEQKLLRDEDAAKAENNGNRREKRVRKL